MPKMTAGWATAMLIAVLIVGSLLAFWALYLRREAHVYSALEKIAERALDARAKGRLRGDRISAADLGLNKDAEFGQAVIHLPGDDDSLEGAVVTCFAEDYMGRRHLYTIRIQAAAVARSKSPYNSL